MAKNDDFTKKIQEILYNIRLNNIIRWGEVPCNIVKMLVKTVKKLEKYL